MLTRILTLISVVAFVWPSYAREPQAERAKDRPVHKSRGYVTTPEELSAIARKAARGIEPYKNAVLGIENFANTGSATPAGSKADPGFWPYGEMDSEPTCATADDPEWFSDGSKLVEAKTFVYHLTGDERYAEDARKHILDVTRTTGWGGEVYTGANQCLLNLNHYVPAWIIAADLLEGFPGWTEADKARFQNWLSTEIYRKTASASDEHMENWGSSGSMATAYIADYLADTRVQLTDRQGDRLSPAEAYLRAKQRQLDRMNGNSYMKKQQVCPDHDHGVGIRPDGGIPWELVRGSTGCDGKWLQQNDKSYTYMMTSLQGMIQHAELLRRRGDTSLYDNVGPNGGGSLRRAILFIIHNPNNPSRSFEWKESMKGDLEFPYRYYRDPWMGEQLRVGKKDRYVAGPAGRMLYFGTLLAGFAPNEEPAPPVMTDPPGRSARAAYAEPKH